MSETAQEAVDEIGFTPTFKEDEPYGTIHGDQEHYACHSQDGFYFRADGSFIPEMVSKAQRARLAEMGREASAVRAAEAAFSQAMGGSGSTRKLSVGADTSKAEEGVDLAAWAMGKKKYAFGVVQKTIWERFEVKIGSREQALEALRSHDVIPGKAR